MKHFYKDELLEFLKEYHPQIEMQTNKDYPDDIHAVIKFSNKTNNTFEIKYNYYFYPSFDEDFDDDYEEEWGFKFYEYSATGYCFHSFEDLKKYLSAILENKICLLIAEQNGKTIGYSLSELLYTKEMKMQKGRSILAKTIPSLREIKRFIKNHGTIKVLYWDETKNFEYQVH